MSTSLPPLQGAPNFRDLGGCAVADGRVLRRGHVFRSQCLAGATDADLAVLESINIGTVFDLRGPADPARRPNRWPAGRPARTIALPPPPGAERADPEWWKRRVMEEAFDAGEAKAEMIRLYRSMPTRFAAHLAELFAYLAEPASAPILIHCEAGKDRTGFVCAVLLLALGASREAVFADYLLSRELYVFKDGQSAMLRFFGRDLPERVVLALRTMFTVHEEYLEAALGEIETGFGSIETYLGEAAGVTPEQLQRVAVNLLRG